MPTESIPFGVRVSMTGGVVYAVPATVKATLFTDGAATFEQSLVYTPFSPIAVTVTAGVASISAPFIRSSVQALVFLKRD
jgi:hypothetical protein